MKLCLSAVIVIFLGASLVSCQNTKKFHVITNVKLSWHKALHYCYSRGWRLAAVTTKAENDRLDKQLRDAGSQENWTYWIGGTTLGNEPYFYWMGYDKPFSFSNWHTHGEPNNWHLVEDCVEIWHLNGALKWNDANCNNEDYFVCEESS